MKLQFYPLVAICAFGSTSSQAGLPGKPTGPKPAELPNRRMNDNDKARQVMNDFAVCMVKLSPKVSEAALERQPFAASFKALDQLVNSDCINVGALQMPAALLRGAMFRALYLRDFRKAAPAGERPAINYFAHAGVTAAEQGLASLRAFSSCVSHANPKASRALVLANVATPAEAQAIDKLRPNLADCLKDGTFKLSRGTLQGLIAETLYREAPRVASVQQGSN